MNQQKIADDKKTADYAAESIKKQTDAYARMAAAQIEAQQKMADSSAVLADAQGKLTEAQQKNASTSREQNTAHDLSTGAISKHTADKKANDAKIAAENDAYDKRKNESYDASAHGGMTYTG